ncbi:tryptophan--tRNA ligase [Candidatus Saccharibacteria bacterium]|nr:MAG: tryptophan--tRNA ligase [Candidatus Saccharibacteria bacterium]
MTKQVILTGLRANNDLHIGNYFGALLPLIDMAKTRSDEYDVHLFVPDLHSFTTPIDYSQLQDQIMHNLRLYAAAGLPLDNPSVRIYRQSFVPAHSELTVILNSFTGMGQMERMTQFKDKSGKLGVDSISVGLFDYPVLMAADILLYGAKYVPVGDDQSQHLEFARDIAERMNSKFARELFTVPEPVTKQHEFFHGIHSFSAEGGKDQPSPRLRPAGQGLRIKDLQDPTKKMSKSDESGKGIIFLGDSPEAAAKKIHSAATDSFGRIDVDNQDQPGIVNLMQILALATGNSYEEIKTNYTGQTQYGPLKIDAAVAISEFLHAFQDRLAAVDETKLTEKLRADEVKMNEIANQTLLRVQKAVGLRPVSS